MNIKEVAKQAGVSITTVSRVLNSPEAVSDKTKEKVLSVMKDLNYTPNWFARNLQSRRTNVIGMLVPDFIEQSNMEFARGVEKIARQKSCGTMLCNAEQQKDIEASYLEMLVERRIDGIVLVNSLLAESDLKLLEERNIPVVHIEKPETGTPDRMVYTNYDTASEEVVDYLIGMGRKRIALVLSEKQQKNGEERKRGYLKALDQHHLIMPDNYVLSAENTLEGGFVAVSRLLAMPEPPDAIFLATDIMAFGAMEKLKQEGITPEEIGIVGYGDLDVSAVMDPKLTTVSKPSYRMGLTAARLLFDAIEDGEDEKTSVMIQSKLKIRRSCGNSKRLKEIL